MAGCSYTHLALLIRLPQAERKGASTSQGLERLGTKDQLVRWFKTKQRPDWMSPAAYDALPESLVLRELRSTVDRPDFHTNVVTLGTTWVDSQKDPKSELAEQHQKR